jgi:uncharacterized protein (TIGR02588 family)
MKKAIAIILMAVAILNIAAVNAVAARPEDQLEFRQMGIEKKIDGMIYITVMVVNGSAKDLRRLKLHMNLETAGGQLVDTDRRTFRDIAAGSAQKKTFRFDSISGAKKVNWQFDDQWY